MKVSLMDVANLAQVSKTTASRAINNEGRIDPQTKQRVLDAVKELNYQPNRVARSLRAQRSHVIGVILSNLFAGHFYYEIFRGIEENAFQKNYTLILGCSDGSPQKEAQLIESFAAQQVDGIILTPTPSFTSERIKRLEQLNIPVVCIDRTIEHDVCDFVGTDNYVGGQISANYLLQMGYRHIVICPGPEGNCSSVQNRMRGATDVLKNSGLQWRIITTTNVTNSSQYGYEAVHSQPQLFSKQNSVAIMAMTDSVALGCIRAVTELGLTVGGDIAIIGYNNDDVCKYLQTPLTTVEQPKYAIGSEAIRLLLQRIEQEAPTTVQRIILQPKLIVRMSCGEKKENSR